MKAVTKLNINQIAQKANVSVATVSRVINNADCVKPATREKVQRIIDEYGYVPNSIAQNLSKSSSRDIGVIFPDLENTFFQQILRGITRVADEKGYNVLIFNTDEQAAKEHRILQGAKGANLAGIIISPVIYGDDSTKETLEAYEQMGIPVVLMDRPIEDGDFNEILVENAEGSYQAVKCLIEEGHREIGFLKGNGDVQPVREREAGYRRALTEYGLPYQERHVMCCDQKCDKAYEQMKILMEQEKPPTAIFTSNNMMTLGCIRYLIEKGYRIGQDIALIGFDDVEVLQMLDFKLSVVTRSEENMGIEAMEMILHRLDGGIAEHESKRMKTELILRGSEKCIRV